MLATITIDNEAATSTQTGPADTISAAIVTMIERVKPSVVQVVREGRGGGAGVVWHTDGLVITNHHVVAGSGGAIWVLLPDGRKLAATVRNAAPELDLALLEVAEHDLPAALIDDSTKLRVGELVFAIGHPWGQLNVVTAGIVSALGEVPVRTARGERPAQYVRSDVLVQPGNSGGPLLNARGAVVGINAMIFGGDLTVAIPSAVAEAWVGGLPSHRVYMGVEVQSVELPVVFRRRGRFGRAGGLLVVGLDKDGPAERGGVQVGDVLLAVADRPVFDGNGLQTALAERAAHDRVPFQVLRGGAIQAVEVELGARERSA